jgi:beta-glucosidase-like glycosyl hydrolase
VGVVEILGVQPGAGLHEVTRTFPPRYLRGIPPVRWVAQADDHRRFEQGLLRERVGFEGVVVTDSQGMAPIFVPFGPGEGAVRSLLAGNDLVLNSPNPTQAFRHVQRALRSGRLPREQVEESATRVVALRRYLARLQAETS